MKLNKTRGMSAKTAAKILCITIILVLISGLGASVLQTSFGKVDIIKFTIPTENGQWLSGNIFKPVEASSENKVPVVITCHGYLNNSKMQDISAIELSRRGIAVIAMDAYYHGGSSSSKESVMDSVVKEGTGMIPLVDFAYSHLNYIDNRKIGIMGHSMGGMDVWMTLMHYGSQYYSIIEKAQKPDSDGGTRITSEEQAKADGVNKVHSGFPTSNVRLSSEKIFQSIHANVGINYAKNDEGCYDLTNGNGDLSGNSYESLSAINSIFDDDKKIKTVEIGKFYGDAANKTLRVIYNPKEIHILQHFSFKSAGYTVDFFQKAFQLESPIKSNHQIWFLKELFNLIGLIAVFIAIVPIAVLLMEIPVFKGLKGTAPEPLIALDTRRSKAAFWLRWIISWVISWISFMPISKLDKYFFSDTASFQSTKWFSQPSTNFILLWGVFNGIVGIILFWITYKSEKKSKEITTDMLGIKIGLSEFLKTLALAICVFIGFYGFVFATEYFFNTDFRIWLLAVCSFSSDKLIIALQYWPLFLIFFFALSLSNNIISRAGNQKEWLNLLICGLGNALGIIIINAIQYITIFTTGVSHWQADRLYPIVVLPLIVLLFAAAYIGRSLYKATGKVWLGALVNCMIIVMIGIANTATLSLF
ncbi:alpha/beta hydrolase [Vallitalea maricola]|uniref:Alpha/beta fold hydrolase n=1 Tax=Vallitalea maricola TaxID=3074433 RepID=A0ACB5UHD9_9FIRM|nr:alpha/beta fold hydrolase [Vallitalea sp. AN17-2]